MKCKNCNKEINFEDKFCTGCGYMVGNENLKINKKIKVEIDINPIKI